MSLSNVTGDMSKPIYRYFADQKWREYPRKIIVQRITQMKVIPDVLAHCDPTVDTKLYYGRKPIRAGDFLSSQVTVAPPTKLEVQMFERGQKLVTIAVADPDVPNVEKDSFDSRIHYLAINIPISAVSPEIVLSELSPETQVVLPWLPPVVQKGDNYHRLSVFIMEQKDGQPLDFAAAKARETSREARLRVIQRRYHLNPIGAHLFRSQWDETTFNVMKEIGFEGADMELYAKKIDPLPYKRRTTRRMR